MTPPGPTHLLIVLAVLVLLFGAKRLPDLARSVGRSSRILRAELTAPDERPARAPDASEPDGAQPDGAQPDGTEPPAQSRLDQ